MSNISIPTDEELQKAVLDRCRQYASITSAKDSTIGRAIANDGNLIFQIRNGNRRLTLATYHRIMAWFDENWPDQAAAS